MHTTNNTPAGGELSFAMEIRGNAARSGVVIHRGFIKSKRPDVEASGRLGMLNTLSRGPLGATNTEGATCTEGSTNAHTHQSGGRFIPDRHYNHTSARRG